MGTDFNTNKPYHPDLKTPEQIFVPTPQMRIRTKVTAKGTQKILCEIISKTPVKATSHKPLPLKMIRLLGTPFIGILRILFPATEERLRVQVAHLHEALIKNKEPEDVQSFIMGAFKKGHREKQVVINTWLSAYLLDKQHDTPFDELCRLMDTLADDDMNPQEREDLIMKLKESVETVQIKDAFPLLEKAVKTFILVYDQEKITEGKFHFQETKECLHHLLSLPNLLKRDDVQKRVFQMPKSALRQKVLHEMNLVSSRILEKAHQSENALLQSLPGMLQELSVENLKEQYCSDQEEALLEATIKDLPPIPSDRLRESLQSLLEQSEEKHLKAQKAAMEKAQKFLEELTDDTLEKTNQTTALEAKRFFDTLVERRNKLLEASKKSLKDPTTSEEIKTRLTTMIDEIEKTYPIPMKISAEGMEDEKVDHRKFLRNALPLSKNLQTLEVLLLSQAANPHDFLNEVNGFMAQYTALKTHLDTVHTTVKPWKELSQLQTCVQREMQRQNDVAKDVILLSLEKVSDFILPLRLAKMDVSEGEIKASEAASKEENKENTVERKLRKAALALIQKVQDKHVETVKATLYSLSDYTRAFSQTKDLQDIVQEKEKKPFDFTSFGQQLNLQEELSQWHADLQKIWFEHVPDQERQKILQISLTKGRIKQMEQAFKAWYLSQTLSPFTGRVTFEERAVPSLSEERKAAVATISKFMTSPGKGKDTRSRIDKLRAKLQQRLEAANPLTAPSVTARVQGVEDFLNTPNTHHDQLKPVALPNLTYTTVSAQEMAASNPMQALKMVRMNIFNNLEQQLSNHHKQEQWIQALADYPELHSVVDRRLMILSECRNLVAASFENQESVSDDIKVIFLQQFRQEGDLTNPLDFSHLNNRELREFLNTFLKMTFAKNTPITVTNQQRNFLIQFFALSDLKDEEIDQIRERFVVSDLSQRGAPSPSSAPYIQEVAQQLQKTAIGLEGMEESALLPSIRESKLPKDPKTRQFLDRWAARSGEQLLENLLEDAIKGHDHSHFEGREAIGRAIFHAFKKEHDDGYLYVGDLLDQLQDKDKQFNAVTLAVSLEIFYLDFLYSFDSLQDKQDQLTKIRTFNEQLIKSRNIPQMLLGYSREISRLSKQVTRDPPSQEEFARLLKCKIAYQQLKLEYFTDKVDITGFLKQATGDAEIAMIETRGVIETKLAQREFLERMQPLLLTPIFSAEPYQVLHHADKLLVDYAKHSDERPFVYESDVPGYLSWGTKIQIDGVHGVVYYDGNQQVSLPAELQYNETIRALAIDKLPYSQKGAGSPFIYYTNAGGVKKPQIIVSVNSGEPLVHKSLPTSFTKDASSTLLQYIPTDDISLPAAISDRLGIKSFWLDRQNKIYGYDTQGNLALILNQKADRTNSQTREWTVTLKDQKNYTTLTEETLKQHASDPVLERLLACYGPNEILVNWTTHAFFIPALEMSIKKDPKSLLTPIWKCEGKGVTGKELDMDAPPVSGYLSLKNEGKRTTIIKLKKELEAANQALKKGEIPDLSRVDKQAVNQLKSKVERLTRLLHEAEGRVLLGGLPANAFEENSQFLGPIHEKILLKRSAEGAAIFSHDFNGALALCVCSTMTPKQLMRELASYPLTQPLTESQAQLLEEAFVKLQNRDNRVNAHYREEVEAAENEDDTSREDFNQLCAYLNLLKYQSLNFQMGELAHCLLSEKKEKADEIKRAFDEQKATCERLLEILPNPFPALADLWRKTKLAKVHLMTLFPTTQQAVAVGKQAKSIVSQEFATLSSQTLLERFALTDRVAYSAKDPNQELSLQHQALITSFKTHSKDQVAGFYLEELGIFTLDGLCKEFRINKETDRGLYGINEERVEELFRFLIKEQYITYNKPGHSLASPEFATTAFNRDQLRASMRDLSFSETDLENIMDRLQTFLFKAMQAGFKSEFKDNKVESELTQKLELEKKIHVEKYLDAEAFIKGQLDPHGINLVDLKYAVLSEDYQSLTKAFQGLNAEDPLLVAKAQRDLAALRNAMIRYLFHKTEVQHLDNILQAPNVGERNKIELLQTKRSYSVDKLLQVGLDEKEREEQIMQRAFLIFEEDYGFRCNAMQIKMFRSLLLDTSHIEAIDAAQARMGFGKTALLPIMAIVRVAIERSLKPKEKHLVRYVVPRAVIEDNTSSFHQRLSSITGGKVIKDTDFTRYQIDPEYPLDSYQFILHDLNERLAFYQDVQAKGNILIQWPEIRGSMEAQDLDFGMMLCNENMPAEQRALCIQCKKVLGQIRGIDTYTIFDELDDTQEIRSREVNYTMGDKTPISKASLRPMERLIDYIETHDDYSDLKTVAREMLIKVGEFQSSEVTDELVTYLTDRNQPLTDEIKNLLSPELQTFIDVAGSPKNHTEKDSALFLIRAILLDPNMLVIAKDKKPSTHFGVRFAEKEGQRVYFQDPESESSLLIAVPYEGTNTPKGLSVFDNTEVAGITTMRYYRDPQTLLAIQPHLDFLLKQLRRDKIPQKIALEYLNEDQYGMGQRVFEELTRIAGMLDAEELKQAKEHFYNMYMKNPTKGFRKFLGMTVVATQIRSDAASAKSDRYESSSQRSVVKGCSGTVGGTSSYFSRQETDPAADGKLSLDIMGRANNAQVQQLTPPDPTKDYLTEILTTLLANSNQNTRALVDAAGICKSSDGNPETIVKKLWELLQHDKKIKGIEGIVYYGKDNVKRLYRGPHLPPIACTTALELASLEGKKYFSFYGQKNTRGSDIKQANGAHALVTIDENVTNSDAKQAVLRFRNLVNKDSAQTFSFALMPHFANIVKSKTLSTEETIEAKDVAIFLRLQEKEQEQKAALTIFRKEMSAHVKQAAAHLEQHVLAKSPINLTETQQQAYQTFLIRRNEISAFVERSVDNLYEKYGTATQDQERDLFIKAQRDKAEKGLNELFIAARIFATSMNRVNVSLERDYYTQHIERSVTLFKSRFDDKATVHVPKVDSGAIAIAVALAEAFAQAEAEAQAQAESLSLNEIHVQKGVVMPHLVTTNQPHIKANLDFLTDPSTLTAVADYRLMRHLIRPDDRGQFKVSNFLVQQNMISHFVLWKGEEFIFIAQEEAELFKQRVVSGGDRNGYHLSDARTLKGIVPSNGIQMPNNLLVKQVTCVAFGANGVPKGIVNQGQLQTTQLDNVPTAHLLPQLEVKTETSQAIVKSYVNLNSFGLTQNVSNLQLQIVPTTTEVTIALQGENGIHHTVVIPKNNILLNQYIAQHPNAVKIKTFYDETDRAFKNHKSNLEWYKSLLVSLPGTIQNQEQSLRDPNFVDLSISPRLENLIGNYDNGQDYRLAVGCMKTDYETYKSNPSDQNLSALQQRVSTFQRFLVGNQTPASKGLKDNVSRLKETVDNLKSNKRQLELSRTEVQHLTKLLEENKYKETVAQFKTIVDEESSIYYDLKRKGICFTKAPTFLDCFHFRTLQQQSNTTCSLTLTGTMPEYHKLVEAMEEEIPNAMGALTKEEAVVLEQNRTFLRHVNDLSGEICVRDVTFKPLSTPRGS